MGLLNVLSKFGKTATATNRSASNSRGKTVYADSSTVSSDEVPYYREDSYYTLYSYPDSMMQTKIITFEERKGTAIPSARGLYPAQIMLLSYCETGRYPKPNGGYPGFWWFEYGIRDVGHALENLAANGFLEWAPKAHSLSSLKVAELEAFSKTLACPQLAKRQILSIESYLIFQKIKFAYRPIPPNTNSRSWGETNSKRTATYPTCTSTIGKPSSTRRPIESLTFGR